MMAGCLRAARIAGAAVAVVVLVAIGQNALAQPPKVPTAPAPRAHATPARPAPKKGAPDSATPAQPAPVSASGGAVAPFPNDAGVVEAKTLDGGTHVFRFSELDIEGRLKSPQLVYFLRRVRAEFAAGDLGHRTFMREMSETRKESSF
jgi:hypothetical protein